MTRKKTVSKKSSAKPKVLEVRVSLNGTSPQVWRKFLVHDLIFLSELHLLIQMVMGWDDTHLYEFQINGKSYGRPDPFEAESFIDASKFKLSDILGDSRQFTYIYDFGDNWVHTIEILAEHDHNPKMIYPICIGGENACPPEDCGGPTGFEEFKKSISGKDSQRKSEFLEWVGGYYNVKSFDPNFVNKYLLWPDGE